MVISTTQNIYIRMYPKVPGPRSRGEDAVVSMVTHPDYIDRLPEDTDYVPPWVDINSSFRVEIRGDGTGFGSCYMSNDPRISSFDLSGSTNTKTYYSLKETGEYIALKSTSPRKLEVSIKQRTGDLSEGASVCGVIIREGNAAYEIDRCGSSLKYLRRSEHELPYNPISKSGTTNYRITMPSGAFVEAIDRGTWLNLFVYVPWREWEQTEGLCGTYDGDIDNEHKRRGSTVSDEWDRYPDPFIASWQVTPEEDIFNMCLMPEDTSIPVHLQEDRYCSLFSDDMTGKGCGWEDLKNNIQDGSDYTEVQHQLPSCASPLSTPQHTAMNPIHAISNSKSQLKLSPYPFTLQNASDYCRAFLEASPSFGPCGSRLNDSIIDREILNCAEDLSLTGQLIWVEGMLSVFQKVCSDGVFAHPGDATLDEILSEARNLTEKLCPDDCNNQGTCQQGLCQCNEGLMGFDCSLLENAVPDLQVTLDPNICGVQEGQCLASRILALHLSNKDTLTCQMSIDQVHGNSLIHTVSGSQFSIDEIHCPLPWPSDLNTSSSAWPAYRYYDVQVSNNGIDYSNTLTQHHVVYDSACLLCDQQANCVRKVNTCMIQAKCYDQYHVKPDDVCMYCNPDKSDSSWSSLEGNRAPVVLYSMIHRQNGTNKTMRKITIDPENHKLTHVLEDSASHPDVQLFSNGTLKWQTGPAEVSKTIRFTVTDECGQTITADIALQLTCLQSICSYHGLCLYELGMSICLCDQYFTGDHCEREIQVGEWTNWTDTGCSKECDFGVLTKTRICLREPCAGETVDRLVCNTYNCPELNHEKEAGVNMTVEGTEINTFALLADELLAAVSGVTDEYCVANPDKCCTSFGLDSSNSLSWASGIIGKSGGIHIASSYPRELNGGEDTGVKIVAGVDENTLFTICGVGRVMIWNNTGNETLLYMDPSVLYKVLTAGEAHIEEHLGIILSIDDPSPPGNQNVIIGASVGAACVAVLVIVLVVLQQKGKLTAAVGVSQHSPNKMSAAVDDNAFELSIDANTRTSQEYTVP